MIAKCYSAAINGADASMVEIEVYCAKGPSSFAIVGLPDAAVKEAKDRVSTALKSSGFKTKDEFAVTVNLAPADVRKEGPSYDLPIAIGLLAAKKTIAPERLAGAGLVGELSLSGRVRRVRGVLPIVMEMRRIGKATAFVPADNVEEASVVEGIDVIPVSTLREAVDHLNGVTRIEPVFTDIGKLVENNAFTADDFCEVKGQAIVKRALEVAVAGSHNVLMIGSPGSGKTMLARRIPSILPPMTVEEALEVSRIHSVAGREKTAGNFVTTRPFRAPHHTVSSIGLLGGGAHPVPGEVSLAHRGVLFLDEFPEFPRNALEVLRQPLEDGHVAVARASAACDYPSRFMLVAAMNPCPCGYYGDATRECRCSQRQILQYQRRISGPLLDRIDIHVGVGAVPMNDLERLKPGESSADIRKRVAAARKMQKERYRGCPGVLSNADAKSALLQKACRLTDAASAEIRLAMGRMNLSARGYDRVLRVSRTIADLDGKESVDRDSVMEAISYRQMDTEGDGAFWA